MDKEQIYDFIETRVQSKMQAQEKLIWDVKQELKDHVEKFSDGHEEIMLAIQRVANTGEKTLEQATRTNGRVLSLEKVNRDRDRMNRKIGLSVIIFLLGIVIMGLRKGFSLGAIADSLLSLIGR